MRKDPRIGEDEYLTVNDVAALWKVDQRTVRRAIRAGHLPVLRLPGTTEYGRIRIRRSAAEAALRDRSEAS